MKSSRNSNGNLLDDELRTTKIGRFLRKSSLDELPEIFNVLVGNMSFVGPRPLLIEYNSLYDETQKQRLNIIPGITGLAQINGRNSITWEKKFQYDIYYINNDLQKCIRCNKIWCDNCNKNCKYINWIYFKIHLPVCHRCYNDLLTTSFVSYHG